MKLSNNGYTMHDNNNNNNNNNNGYTAHPPRRQLLRVPSNKKAKPSPKTRTI
jgi:hypothetical protein